VDVEHAAFPFPDKFGGKKAHISGEHNIIGLGLADLVTAISHHQTWAIGSGNRDLRIANRAKIGLRLAVLSALSNQLELRSGNLDSLSAQVAAGKITTEEAVKTILIELGISKP
jgi:hypothetical protein